MAKRRACGHEPISDKFVTGFLEDVFCHDEILFVFREDIMNLNVIQEIRQHVALKSTTPADKFPKQLEKERGLYTARRISDSPFHP